MVSYTYQAIELLLGGLFVAVAMRFSATVYAECCAFTLHRIYCVSAAAPGGFSSDKIVSTTSATWIVRPPAAVSFGKQR